MCCASVKYKYSERSCADWNRDRWIQSPEGEREGGGEREREREGGRERERGGERERGREIEREGEVGLELATLGLATNMTSCAAAARAHLAPSPKGMKMPPLGESCKKQVIPWKRFALPQQPILYLEPKWPG